MVPSSARKNKQQDHQCCSREGPNAAAAALCGPSMSKSSTPAPEVEDPGGQEPASPSYDYCAAGPGTAVATCSVVAELETPSTSAAPMLAAAEGASPQHPPMPTLARGEALTRTGPTAVADTAATVSPCDGGCDPSAHNGGTQSTEPAPAIDRRGSAGSTTSSATTAEIVHPRPAEEESRPSELDAMALFERGDEQASHTDITVAHTPTPSSTGDEETTRKTYAAETAPESLSSRLSVRTITAKVLEPPSLPDPREPAVLVDKSAAAAAAAAALSIPAAPKKRSRVSAPSIGASPPAKYHRRGGSPRRSQQRNDDSFASPASAPASSLTPDASSSLLSAGRWTAAEHQAFLSGLALYGREWKRVAMHIPTRTSSQVRSHAQKYFTKVQQQQHQMQQQQQMKQQQQQSASFPPFSAADSALLPPPSSVYFPSASASPMTAAAAPPSSLLPSLSSSLLDPSHGAASAVSAEDLTPSVRANVERILAQPETVQFEVESTLQRLRERYRELQQRLRNRQLQQQRSPARQRIDGDPDHGSVQSSMSVDVESVCNSLQDSELIALHVLQGGLDHQSAASSSSPSTPATAASPLSSLSPSRSASIAALTSGGGGIRADSREEEAVAAPREGDTGSNKEVPPEEQEDRPNPQDPPSSSEAPEA